MAIQVGDASIVPLVDGSVRLPPDYYAGVDWSRHGDLLSANGTLDLPIGCFLVTHRGRSVLVDSGVGPRRLSWAEGGQLPAQLHALGVRPRELAAVVCTHAHIDHVGGVAHPASPLKTTTLLLGAGELDQDLAPAVQAELQERDRQGRLTFLRDGDAVIPGVTVMATPGHTPGHLSIVVASGLERALILGDVVISPAELSEPDWVNLSDVDAGLARQTRETMWRDLETSGDRFTGSHFPGLRFGRILVGSGRQFVTT